MKIGFSLFGIIYGDGGQHNDQKDIKHCWQNIKNMLIEPFQEKGFDVEVFLSTYPVQDSEKFEEILKIVNPKKIVFSEFANSNSFTTKIAALNAFNSEDNLDVVVITRSDLHFSKKIANDNIDFKKFNFLFKERGNWQPHQFTTDNFYMFPYSMTGAVTRALNKTYGSFYHTTHALYNSLIQEIPQSDIHFISNEIEEMSDVNSYYTVCRKCLDSNNMLMHPEVRSRFYA